MNIIKRDGRKQEFSREKIEDAVYQAASRVQLKDANVFAESISYSVVTSLLGMDNMPVNDVHNLVEIELMKKNPAVAKEYITYRQHRSDIRESKSSLMDAIGEISQEMHHDNANTNNSAASKMYGIAEAANKKFVISKLLKPIHAENHKKGLVYINDLA